MPGIRQDFAVFVGKYSSGGGGMGRAQRLASSNTPAQALHNISAAAACLFTTWLGLVFRPGGERSQEQAWLQPTCAG